MAPQSAYDRFLRILYRVGGGTIVLLLIVGLALSIVDYVNDHVVFSAEGNAHRHGECGYQVVQALRSDLSTQRAVRNGDIVLSPCRDFEQRHFVSVYDSYR